MRGAQGALRGGRGGGSEGEEEEEITGWRDGGVRRRSEGLSDDRTPFLSEEGGCHVQHPCDGMSVS